MDLRLALGGACGRARSLADAIDGWFTQETPETVYWVGRGEKHGGVLLVQAPLHVGKTLREHLFDRAQTVVMTSATLAVGSPPKFHHLIDSLGVGACKTLAVGTPFDLEHQVTLG